MRIWVCSPHKDLVHPKFMASLREQEITCAKAGIELVIVPDLESRGTFITVARNRGCVHALVHKCDAILMFDDDMSLPDPSGVVQLVEAMADGKPIVSAFCRSRHSGIVTHGMGLHFRHDGQLSGTAIPKEAITYPGLYRIGHTGTGVLLVAAEVLWEMRQRWRSLWAEHFAGSGPLPIWHHPWFEMWPAATALACGCGRSDSVLGTLPEEPEALEFLDFYNKYDSHAIAHAWSSYVIDNNEDCVFSVKANQIGADMWLDTRVTTNHYGERNCTTSDILPGGREHELFLKGYERMEAEEREKAEALRQYEQEDGA